MNAIFNGFGPTLGFDMSPLKNCGEDCPIGIGEKGEKGRGMDLGKMDGGFTTLIDMPKDEANLRIPGSGAEIQIPDLMPGIVIDENPLKIQTPDTSLPEKGKQLHFGGRLNTLA